MHVVVLDFKCPPLEWFLLFSWMPWLWTVNAVNTNLIEMGTKMVENEIFIKININIEEIWKKM